MATIRDKQNEIVEARFKDNNIEKALTIGLTIPNYSSITGSRTTLAATQKMQVLPIMDGEVPYLSAGWENQFGSKSSSVIIADDDYIVINKIQKFSFAPDVHYWLILLNERTKELDMVERVSYHHQTSEFGYLFNNKYMDKLSIGNKIYKGDKIKQSISFDECGNRTDGLNMMTIYTSTQNQTEDPFIVSESAAKRIKSPLLKNVERHINNNTIPLNLYGDDYEYKIMPDIGEDIKDSTLMATRQEKSSESLFAQSNERLKQTMFGDEITIASSKVVDVDIYANIQDPEVFFKNPYFAQIKKYFDENMRVAKEFVSFVYKYVCEGYTLSYDLSKKYNTSISISKGAEYIDKKVYGGIRLNIMTLQELPLKNGDKLVNRYGGKGVAIIKPDEEMFRVKDKYTCTTRPVDIQITGLTMPNRENPAQCFELSLNFINRAIVDNIAWELGTGNYSTDDCIEDICDFYDILSENMGHDVRNYLTSLDDFSINMYINDIIDQGYLYVVLLPIRENITIDTIDKLYKRFPRTKEMYEIQAPIKGSNGKIRYVKPKGHMVAGAEYFYRLIQFAEDKYSSVSLSTTSMNGLNAKSTANKNALSKLSSNPVKKGTMETSDSCHMGSIYVAMELMLHSLSPEARVSIERMYYDNPYEISIELDENAKNRSVEIVNAYLKAIGRKIVFEKRMIRHVPLLKTELFYLAEPSPIELFITKKQNGSNYVPPKWNRKYSLFKLEKKDGDCDGEIK